MNGRIRATECLALSLVAIVHIYCLISTDFMFKHDAYIRWFATVFSFIPTLFIYSLIRWIARPWFSAIMTSSVLIILGKINQVKLSQTAEPITWADLATDANIEIIKKYISWSNSLLLLSLLSIACVVFVLERRKLARPRSLGYLSLATLILGTISLYPYMDTLSERLGAWTSDQIQRAGVTYVVWNWPENVNRNGLLVHLIQTSRRPIPVQANQAQREAFETLTLNKLASSESKHMASPSNVIIILCESCWHDDAFFYEAFEPLRHANFTELRAISPVFGGLTVNSSFELLAGLPANNGILKGVVYQDYHQVMKDHVFAFPRQMNQAGYNTWAAHNFNREFWHRDVINPKLGFNHFYSLEDMELLPFDGMWPDDQILFDFVISRLEQSPKQNFMYLTTVSTHGPYEDESDGEINYANRMHTAAQQIAEFADRVLSIEPDTLILLVGDHKPSLMNFYTKHGILLPSDPQIKRGDVPAYVLYKNTEHISIFIAQANQQPLFCLSYHLDDLFTQSNLPAFNYIKQEKICDVRDLTDDSYEQQKSSFPGWLYSLSMFE